MESGPQNFTFAVSRLIHFEMEQSLPDYISNRFMLVFPVLVVYGLEAVFGISVSWPYLVFFVLAVHTFVLHFSETPICGILLESFDPISKDKHSACEGVHCWLVI